METRAHHILIGVFMLTMVAGLFAFIIWAAKVDIDTQFSFYDIYFEESVAGLSIGSDVSYRGVSIGQVRTITLDRDDPGRVRVTIRVVADTPIRRDSVASLEYQGLTGLAFVQISGGTAAAPPLTPGPEGQPPVIDSEPSQIQALFTGAPDLIRQGIIMLQRVSSFLDEENRVAVANILASTDRISSGLADRTGQIQAIIDNADGTLRELRQAAKSVNALAQSATGVVDQDLRALVADLREVSQSIRDLSRSLNQAVVDNSQALAGFSSNTLPELALFVQEARRLASSIARIAERIEQSPTDFIFSDKKPEYEGQ